MGTTTFVYYTTHTALIKVNTSLHFKYIWVEVESILGWSFQILYKVGKGLGR